MNESMNEDENENVVESSNPAAAAAAAAAAASLEPIGKEYIETKLDGKILSFYCKLCDCQFNDPNAKDMHTKGRRHRLAYKVTTHIHIASNILTRVRFLCFRSCVFVFACECRRKSIRAWSST